MAMDTTYKVMGGDGQAYGPVSLLDLNSWIQEGRVTRETSVSRSDAEGWKPAATFTELTFAAPPMSPLTASVLPPLTAIGQGSSSPLAQETEVRIKRGASWFYWIAGLSLINSISALSGGNFGFILGLGITQIIDAVGERLSSGGKTVTIALDLLVLGLFILFGFFASRKHQWAFVVGMILYGLDGLLFLAGMQLLSIGFHVFALYCIFKGFSAARLWKDLEAEGKV